MSNTPRIFILALIMMLIPVAASAENTPRVAGPAAAPSTTGSAVADQPPRAPIGHRQPRATDLPANRSSADDDAWMSRVNRDIDSKLKICRGC